MIKSIQIADEKYCAVERNWCQDTDNAGSQLVHHCPIFFDKDNFYYSLEKDENDENERPLRLDICKKEFGDAIFKRGLKDGKTS